MAEAKELHEGLKKRCTFLEEELSRELKKKVSAHPLICKGVFSFSLEAMLNQ